MAGHMYRMAMMTFLFGEGSGSATKSATDIANQGGLGSKVDRERLMDNRTSWGEGGGSIKSGAV